MQRFLSAALARGLIAPFAIGCLTLALAACGSSSSSSSAGSATSGAAASTAPVTGNSNAPSESLKADTTPKFASPSPSAPVQSGLVQIAYRNLAIDPDTLRVKLGSTIRWTNYDSENANVVSEGGPQQFASKTFGEGGTFEIKAEKPGVIHYECTFFPATMNGSIEVVA